MKRKSNIKPPPSVADRLLNWYAGNSLMEDLQGDMHELFYDNLEKMSVRRAQFKYWQQTLSLLVSYAVKRRKQKSNLYSHPNRSTSTAMLRNDIKIGLRNFAKNKTYSLANVSGLAIALAVSLIMVLYIMDELSYDRFHSKADRIYRLHYEKKFGSNHSQHATTPAVAAKALQEDFPEVEATVRFLSYGTYLVKAPHLTESIKEQNVLWTDSTFFKIFSIKILEGNPKKVLTEPGSIAISKKMAEKYFPGMSALGHSLVLDNKYDAKVTAVYESIPEASHFHADILISLTGDWPAAREAQYTEFSNNNFNTYVLLKEGSDKKKLEKKLPAFLSKYSGESATDEGGDFARLTLMPLTDIHLYSDLNGEIEPNGSITYVYLFATIAIFILVIACINFTNLSTAHSTHRAKEVGVRKVMGSQRSLLIKQFLVESMLITGIAVILGVVAAYLALPFFNNLLQKQLSLPLGDPFFYAVIFATAIFIGVLAGAYPSFFLSSFNPVNVLKGYTTMPTGGNFMRSGLVVVQFVISIILIIGTLTVNKQLSFIQNKKLGFEKDQILLVKDAYALRPNVQAFKNEAVKINGVDKCTISGFVPVEGGSEFSRRDRTFWKAGTQPTGENLVSLQQWSIDADYLETFKMNLIEGRDFSIDYPSDNSAVILNEAAVAHFNLGEDPVGKTINTFGGDKSPDFEHPITYMVSGVVENFHFSSLKQGISPLGFFLGKSDGFISVRFDGNPQTVIASLQEKWKELAPGQPFQYSFLNEQFAMMYASEQRLGKIVGVFGSLAIIIACFGLFALTTFAAKRRTKEIGIRKVLGASVTGIMMLLSREFGKLLMIAFLIAVPIAWFGVNWWLERFSYKVQIGFAVYVLAGILVLVIASITTWHHSFKAASTDPVKSLKSE